MEQYLGHIITGVTLLIAVVGFAYRTKYEVKNLESKVDNHISDNKEKIDGIKTNITTLFERERQHIEAVTEIKGSLIAIEKQTAMILQQLTDKK